MSRQFTKSYTLHVRDQVLATLRDRGPLTTRELAETLPDWNWENTLYRWSTQVSPDWLRLSVMYPLHRKGLVDRTPKDASRPTMWWLPE